MSNILTCIYCGMAYPEGTLPHGSQILTDHIKVCGQHPMRELEAENAALFKALLKLVGVETKEDLDLMEKTIRMMPGIERDKRDALNAVHTLQDYWKN